MYGHGQQYKRLDPYKTPNKKWSSEEKLVPQLCIMDILICLVCAVSSSGATSVGVSSAAFKRMVLGANSENVVMLTKGNYATLP